MTMIPGVELTRNANGEATHVAIDLQKHPEAVSLLKEAGLIPKTKAELGEELTSALSVDEVFDKLEQKINNHYDKRRSNGTS